MSIGVSSEGIATSIQMIYSRFISCNLGIPNQCLTHDVENGLDINGFDKNVPIVIESFIKNLF